MKFFVPSTGKYTKDIPDDKVAGFMAHYPDAVPATGQPTVSAASTPAATPAEPDLYSKYLKPVVENPFVVGAERGFTAEFAPAVSGAMSLLASKVLSPAEGVAPEFLNQEDWYLRGREEQKAMQQRLQEESPWLTGAGAVTGGILGAAGMSTLAPAAATAAPASALEWMAAGPGRLVPAAARTALALPGAAAYGAATGVGKTDILGTPEPLGEKAAELAKNVGTGVVESVPAAVAGSVIAPAVAGGIRSGLSAAQRKAQEFADKALLAKAGPQIAERLQAGTLGGVDQPEVVRVMREAGMGKKWGPEALQTEAKAAAEESGGMLGRMRAEIDRQATALRSRAAESRTAGEAKQKELTARYADRLKAAQEAAKNAAELEAVASKAAANLENQQSGLIRASLQTGPVRPLPSAAEELGVSKFNPSIVEADINAEAAKQAQEEAVRNLRSAGRTAQVLSPKEGEWPIPEPTSQQRRAMWDLSAAELKAQQSAEDVASADYRQRMLRIALGSAPPEPSDVAQLPMRSVVTAKRAIESQRREVEMMQAAAKKAREEADRLMKEAKPTSYEHAQSQMDIIEAERLGGEASKRMISGKDVGAVFRKEAENLFTAEGGTTPAAIQDESQRRLYKALIDQARAAESTGMMTLEQANAKVQGLKNMARWEKSALFSPVDLPPKIEAGRTASRGLAAAETEAAKYAEATPEMADILASRYARMGRGKSTEAPRPEEALGGLRRTYQVSKALEESAAEEAKRVGGLSAMPGIKQSKEGYITPTLSPRIIESYGPSLKSSLAETAAGGLQSLESSAAAMPGLSPQAYIEMLDAIQKSYETPEEPMSMVNQ